LPTTPTQQNDLTIADLFSEYEERLHRYATRLTRDADRAEDLVQDTFIQTMTHLATLRELNRNQRQAWLYRVLKNRFLDQLRAQRRAQKMLEQLAKAVRTDAYPVVDQSFYSLFDQIPERYRSLFEKRYILGMNSTEIGKELGVSPATIRSRLRLALKWLRENQSHFIG